MIYLQITPFFPTPERFNGPFVYDQVRALERNGDFDRVMVMRPASWRSRKLEYSYGGVKVHLFRTFELPSMILPGLFDWLNRWSFRRRLTQLKVDPKAIAVAHAHVSGTGIYALAVKKMNPNVLTVLQYHDPDPATLRLGRLANWGWHMRRTAHRSVEICSAMDLHVGVSRKVIENVRSFPTVSSNDTFHVYNRMLAKLGDIPKIKIKNEFVLYNGVDLQIFTKNTQDVNKTGRFEIGCVANFADWKDQMNLIRAVQTLVKEQGMEDIHLRFIGSGPLLENCRSYVEMQKMMDYVTFEKEVFHEKLIEFYNSLDLFVLTSYFEGFGCVFLEAYACGVPFIAAKYQGIAEYIKLDDQDKWLVEQSDPSDLAKKIAKYRKHRYTQYLQYQVDINILVGDYLKEIRQYIS